MVVRRKPLKLVEKSPTRKPAGGSLVILCPMTKRACARACVVPDCELKGLQKEAVNQHDRPAGQPFEVSQGTIKTWRRCRNKYYYAYIELIEPRRPKLAPLRGTMIGKVLDAMALKRLRKNAPDWRKALEPFAKQYGELFFEERELYGDPIGDVTKIMERYERVYQNDGLTYKPMGKHKDPYEFPIRVSIASGIDFVGHLDKMPTDKQDRVWDMDHKSHKNIPDPEDRFRDLQQVFYQWAMPLSGYPKPAGVIWDYIRTKPPTIPETLKKGGVTQRQNIDTDFETYFGELQRLKLDPRPYSEILAKLKARGWMDFFQRTPLPHPAKELVDNVVAEAIQSAVEIKAIGGVSRVRTIDRTCKQCEYLTICQAELRGLDADFIRKSEYQRNKTPRHIHIMEEGED